MEEIKYKWNFRALPSKSEFRSAISQIYPIKVIVKDYYNYSFLKKKF